MSPKGALVLGPWARTEFYVDAGTGFHSNDARGVTIAVDAAGMPQGRVPLLVRTTGAEVGARTAIVPGLVSTLSFFYLQSDSELTFDGDSGDTEPKGPTRRYGAEWANFYKPTSWLTLSADASYTYARYLHPQDASDGGSGFYIANSIPLVVSAAARLETPVGVFGSVRLRYFSSQPVLEDDAEQQPASTILNALVGYRFKQYELAAEVLNVLDAKADDIAYAYPSRVPDTLLAAARGASSRACGGRERHRHPSRRAPPGACELDRAFLTAGTIVAVDWATFARMRNALVRFGVAMEEGAARSFRRHRGRPRRLAIRGVAGPRPRRGRPRPGCARWPGRCHLDPRL